MKEKTINRLAAAFMKGYDIPIFESRALNRKIDDRAEFFLKQKTRKRKWTTSRITIRSIGD